jgi:hypothetical protein
MGGKMSTGKVRTENCRIVSFWDLIKFRNSSFLLDLRLFSTHSVPPKNEQKSFKISKFSKFWLVPPKIVSFRYASTPGSTWIYQPIFNLCMLTNTFRYDTVEVKIGLQTKRTLTRRPTADEAFAWLLRETNLNHWTWNLKTCAKVNFMEEKKWVC